MAKLVVDVDASQVEFTLEEFKRLADGLPVAKMTPEEFAEMQARVRRIRRCGIDGNQNLFDLGPEGERLYHGYLAAKMERDEAEMKMTALQRQWSDIYGAPEDDHWHDVMSRALRSRPDPETPDRIGSVNGKPADLCSNSSKPETVKMVFEYELDAHPF